MTGLERLRRKAEARELLYRQKPTQQRKESADRTWDKVRSAEQYSAETARLNEHYRYQHNLDW